MKISDIKSEIEREYLVVDAEGDAIYNNEGPVIYKFRKISLLEADKLIANYNKAVKDLNDSKDLDQSYIKWVEAIIDLTSSNLESWSFEEETSKTSVKQLFEHCPYLLSGISNNLINYCCKITGSYNSMISQVKKN